MISTSHCFTNGHWSQPPSPLRLRACRRPWRSHAVPSTKTPKLVPDPGRRRVGPRVFPPCREGGLSRARGRTLFSRVTWDRVPSSCRAHAQPPTPAQATLSAEPVPRHPRLRLRGAAVTGSRGVSRCRACVLGQEVPCLPWRLLAALGPRQARTDGHQARWLSLSRPLPLASVSALRAHSAICM